MTEICCICLDKVKNNSNPYVCKHLIHIECANQWKNSCPLCKSNLKIEKYSNKFRLGDIHGYQVTINKYNKLWDNSKCNKEYKNNHTIRLDKPYGVIGFCSCGSIQGFNWLE